MVQPKTANQLYKDYKADGGTLTFAEFVDREKQKENFPLNLDLNNDVDKMLSEIEPQKKEIMSKEQKTFFGLPVYTLYIAGAVIAGSIVLHIYLKNRNA